MRRLVMAAGVMALLGACTETTIKTSDEGSEGRTFGEGSSQPAKVGDTIRLHGNDEGLVMAVTVTKVKDPTKAPKFFGPGKGKRYVGVVVRLENVGSVVYSDGPGNGGHGG